MSEARLRRGRCGDGGDGAPAWTGARRALVRTIAAGLLVVSLGACASQVDLTSIRREQRMLARRIADTRAEVDRLNTEVARLRGSLDNQGYGGRSSTSSSTMGSASEPYGSPSSSAHGSDYPPSSGSSGDPYGQPSGSHYGQPADPYGQPSGSGSTYGQPQPSGGGAGSTYGSDPNAASGGPSAYGSSSGSTAGGFAAGTGPAAATAGAASSNLQSDMARGSDGEYQDGLQKYSSGDYQRAVQSLRNYVHRNPSDDLVPVAQYWIGESYYAQGKYNESILAFNEILVSWPKSDRKPAALLRQADAFAKTGDKIDARMILQKLIEDHPGTPEAAQAKEQLRTL